MIFRPGDPVSVQDGAGDWHPATVLTVSHTDGVNVEYADGREEQITDLSRLSDVVDEEEFVDGDDGSQ